MHLKKILVNNKTFLFHRRMKRTSLVFRPRLARNIIECYFGIIIKNHACTVPINKNVSDRREITNCKICIMFKQIHRANISGPGPMRRRGVISPKSWDFDNGSYWTNLDMDSKKIVEWAEKKICSRKFANGNLFRACMSLSPTPPPGPKFLFMAKNFRFRSKIPVKL